MGRFGGLRPSLWGAKAQLENQLIPIYVNFDYAAYLLQLMIIIVNQDLHGGFGLKGPAGDT